MVKLYESRTAFSSFQILVESTVQVQGSIPSYYYYYYSFILVASHLFYLRNDRLLSVDEAVDTVIETRCLRLADFRTRELVASDTFCPTHAR